jgi:tripartite-type tricarboxylate transporter receptor subunit TctC
MLKILSAAAAVGIGAMPAAAAQEFPSKNIPNMMPYAAGGPGDTITRIIGAGMTK